MGKVYGERGGKLEKTGHMTGSVPFGLELTGQNILESKYAFLSSAGIACLPVPLPTKCSPCEAATQLLDSKVQGCTPGSDCLMPRVTENFRICTRQKAGTYGHLSPSAIGNCMIFCHRDVDPTNAILIKWGCSPFPSKSDKS